MMKSTTDILTLDEPKSQVTHICAEGAKICDAYFDFIEF